MPRYNPAVDAYIEKSATFAQPILDKIRIFFHKACPDIQEVIKWGFPHFEHKGIVGSMAAFKQHCSFGFWKGKLLKDPHNLFGGVGDTSMIALRVSSLADLPSDKIMLAYIREAVKLNDDGVKLPAAKKTPKKELVIPTYFKAALKRNKDALAIFEAFSPSHQREYVVWVTEAKQEATREKRLAAAIAMMTEGKSRLWKYQK